MTNTVRKKKHSSAAASRRRKKKNRQSVIIFLVSLTIFLIPFIVMAWILLSAALDTGKPILGNRYKGDLDPEIKKSDLDAITNDIKNVSGVESTFNNLATGTLRVYADVNDSASVETMKETANMIYSRVTSVLSEGTYFSQHDGMKMYDLEVHVYNMDDHDSAAFIYVIETKTSSMEAPIVQVVSEAVDEELAQQLRDAVEARNNPQPVQEETELNLGEEEAQEAPGEDSSAEGETE